MPIPDILSNLHTPCFIFDEDELNSNISSFQSSLRIQWSDKARLAYSVKTNPLPWILRKVQSMDGMAETVSDEEYLLALNTGFSAENIIFNGPVKGRRCFEYALMHGSIVNIDSHRELAWAKELAKETNMPINIGVRVNFELESYCPGETATGPDHGRFGFSYENGDLASVIENLSLVDNLHVVGLHMHIGSKSRSIRVYRTIARQALRIIKEKSNA